VFWNKGGGKISTKEKCGVNAEYGGELNIEKYRIYTK
jgi:hypothetical protein